MQASRTLLWQARRRLSQAAAARAANPALASASTSSASENNKSFYLATLPWKTSQSTSVDAPGFCFEESDGVVASSLSASRRLSPIARSLANKVGELAGLGNDSWLLLRASSMSQAQDVVRSRFPADQWDLENAKVRSIELPSDVQSSGPLYVAAAEKILSQPVCASVNTNGPLYGK